MVDDDEAPLQEGQLSLRTIWVGLSVACLAFAALRYAPLPAEFQSLTQLVLVSAIVLVLSTFGYLAAVSADYHTPVYSAWVGTICAGAVFSTLWFGLFSAGADFWMDAIALLFVALLGSISAATFSFFGVCTMHACLTIRPQLSSMFAGAICGGLTGFTAFTTLIFVRGADDAGYRYSVYPTLIGALYAGWAAHRQHVLTMRLCRQSNQVT